MEPSDRQITPKMGFSLIELLIALFVFTIVILSGFACLKVGMGLVDNSRHQTRSAQMMQSEVERIRSMPWSELSTLSSGPTVIDTSNEFNDKSYAIYRIVRTIDGSGDSRKITIEAAWTDIGGRDHTRSYVTQYTRGGLYDYIQ